MTPFTAKKAAASSGLANTLVNVFCSAAPTMPTGIVARMIIQASRSSGVVIDRVRSDVKNPRTIRSQSRQKNAIIAMAVATCSPTMNARYGEPGADTLSALAQLPPISAGSSTLCPRLETGKSSVTPWTRPVTTASRYVRWADISAPPFLIPRWKKQDNPERMRPTSTRHASSGGQADDRPHYRRRTTARCGVAGETVHANHLRATISTDP